MLRSALVLTAGLFVSSLLSASEKVIVFPANHLCSNLEEIKSTLKDYNEVPFAQGIGMVRSGKDNESYEANITVYLSEEGSFTVTAEMDEGIHCMLTSGIQFKPIIPVEYMH